MAREERRDQQLLKAIGWYAAAVWLLLWWLPLPAGAHDLWANNAAVPGWVKGSCCGEAEVHHLQNWQVHALPWGWQVEGYHQTISYGRELPSQDGDYWIFYKTFSDGSQTPVYCFFVPMQAF